MKKFQLTKLAMALVVVMFGFQAMAQGRIDLNGAKSAQQCTIASQDGLSATFSFGSIEATEVSNERGVFSFLEMDGAYSAGNIGEPNLPAANKLIAVPVGAKDVTVNVKNYTTEVYNLADYGINRIYPMQPKLRKDQKPEDIPFEYNEKAYAVRGFVERPIAHQGHPAADAGEWRGQHRCHHLYCRLFRFPAALRLQLIEARAIRLFRNLAG